MPTSEITEDQMNLMAQLIDKDCKFCYGRGCEARFAGNVPVVCRCVEKSLKKLHFKDTQEYLRRTANG